MFHVTQDGSPALGGQTFDSPAEAQAAIDSLRELISAAALRRLKVERVS